MTFALWGWAVILLAASIWSYRTHVKWKRELLAHERDIDSREKAYIQGLKDFINQ
ncbi:hypothetical protein [Vibrio splendidus]|uniref:hypothetical protein n=1 Tax=Vibrio splendidus TaxID=29497 RepID=UPI0012FFF5C9|nr:hypothetical protein [Vibrio splendidus]